MSIVSTIAKTLATLSLCAAASACGDGFDIGQDFEFGEAQYFRPAATVGDLDTMRNIDATGEVGVYSDDGYFSAVSTAPIPSGEVMTIVDYFGSGELLSSLPAGTKLHTQTNEGMSEPGLVLAMVDLTEDDVEETYDATVMLCGGEVDGNGDNWVDIPAEEAVIEIEATDDPNINEVTVTAGAANSNTGEFDVITTVFTVEVTE